MNNNIYAKLKGKISEVYGSQEAFAKILQVEQITVNRRLNGKTAFTADDIMRWSGALGIKKKDIISYFFDEKVGG